MSFLCRSAKLFRIKLQKKMEKKEALDDKPEKNHLSEPTPFEIVTKISAGQILRGYNIQRNIWSRVIPRKQLITIPNQIQLLAPRLGETFRCQEFFSEEKAMLHDHVVQHWGLNVTGSLGVFGRNITADLGFVKTFAGDTFQNEQSRGGYTEIKKPLAFLQRRFPKKMYLIIFRPKLYVS